MLLGGKMREVLIAMLSLGKPAMNTVAVRRKSQLECKILKVDNFLTQNKCLETSAVTISFIQG